MRLTIELDMTYGIGPSRVVMLAIEAAHSPGQTLVADRLDIEGASLHRILGESDVGTRVWAHLEKQRLALRYRAEVEVTRRDVSLEGLVAEPLHGLR
jgi:hypothetical protein